MHRVGGGVSGIQETPPRSGPVKPFVFIKKTIKYSSTVYNKCSPQCASLCSRFKHEERTGIDSAHTV